MTIICEFAPAKLNLYLHITGRQRDGYHDLESLVAFADIGDEVTLSSSDSFSFEIVGPMATQLSNESLSDNLVIKAAHSLARLTAHKLDIHLRLTKNLPIASGIGGGSSDAAATLRALARYWDLEASDPRLIQAATLHGQDVPVCLKVENCYMTASGVETAPNLPSAHVVLVNPNIPLPTPKVFKNYKELGASFSESARLGHVPKDVNALAAELRDRHNDLELSASRLMPEIDTILSFLSVQPQCLLARMSGSGATCFGLFESAQDALHAAQKLGLSHPHFWVTSGLINL